MELTNRQKQYLIQLDKVESGQCQFGHDNCKVSAHFAINKYINLGPHNGQQLHVKIKSLPTTIIDGMEVIKDKFNTHNDSLVTIWNDNNHDNLVTAKQNEQLLLHHNYNERLYNGVADIQLASMPIYTFIRFDSTIGKVKAIIRINTTCDELTIDISKYMSSLDKQTRRNILKGHGKQHHLDKIDALLISGAREYLHYSI
jgi:hypothetical protein